MSELNIQRSKIRGYVLYFLFLGVLTFIAGEIILHYLGKPKPKNLGWLSSSSYEVSDELNELHLRGRKFHYDDQDFIVVLLGDSQVECAACSFSFLPEQSLERELKKHNERIKVFSLGTGGWGQDQQLYVLNNYLEKYRADLVVLWQTPQNDIWNNVFPTHWARNGQPKPTYELVEGDLVSPNFSDMYTERFFYKSKVFSAFDTLFHIIDLDGRFDSKLPPAYKAQKVKEDGHYCDLWQRRWELNFADMRAENLSSEKSHLAIHLTPISPRLNYGVELTRRLVNEIRNTVKRKGGEFLTFRTLTLDQNPLSTSSDCSAQEAAYSLNGLSYTVDKSQVDAIYRRINNESDNFEVNLKSHPYPFVSSLDSHLNESTTTGVMVQLGEYIVRNYKF